jgi:hypothetical protein
MRISQTHQSASDHMSTACLKQAGSAANLGGRDDPEGANRTSLKPDRGAAPNAGSLPCQPPSSWGGLLIGSAIRRRGAQTMRRGSHATQQPGDDLLACDR